jgi:hypothetical protein
MMVRCPTWLFLISLLSFSFHKTPWRWDSQVPLLGAIHPVVLAAISDVA